MFKICFGKRAETTGLAMNKRLLKLNDGYMRILYNNNLL